MIRNAEWPASSAPAWQRRTASRSESSVTRSTLTGILRFGTGLRSLQLADELHVLVAEAHRALEDLEDAEPRDLALVLVAELVALVVDPAALRRVVEDDDRLAPALGARVEDDPRDDDLELLHL